jgi:hypothetical protein
VIKWLEGNPVGASLASICAGLLLVSLLLGVVWSFPPSAPDTGAGEEDGVSELNIPELEDSEPLESYSVITERPVFNESRLPVLDDAADGEVDELLADEDVDAPEVELAGVIITPSIRMVTLKSKERPDSLVAFEGQPLEGNYGSWQVSRIAPREVTLSSDNGEELVLKLQVHDAIIEAPPKMETEGKDRDKQVPAEKVADNEDPDRPLTRAEEIRQRIAQRREELRRAAAQEGQEPGQDQTPEEKQDYRSAIQSMVSGRRQQERSDENER